MSPRSIGSQRYTNLLTKMRSWSSSEGIMLVPSTFTGWYRKMMMNAEIASEMMRSRSHTASTGVLRLRDGPGALPGSLYDGSLPPSAILILILIRNLRLPERLLREIAYGTTGVSPVEADLATAVKTGGDARRSTYSRGCAPAQARVTIAERGSVPYVQACIHLGVRVHRDPDGVGTVGSPAGGPGRAGLQLRAAAQGKEASTHPAQGKSVGGERAVPVSDPCLRAGGQDSERDPSAALLLLLRPRHGSQQSAQLL